MNERTPWPVMLGAALRLGLQPEMFWRLSLREWRALVAPQRAALTHVDLNALMQRFPDTSHG